MTGGSKAIFGFTEANGTDLTIQNTHTNAIVLDNNATIKPIIQGQQKAQVINRVPLLFQGVLGLQKMYILVDY